MAMHSTIKSVASKILQSVPQSVSTFMLQSLIDIDMVMMHSLSVQRGNLDFNVGKSNLYRRYWSRIAWEESTYRIMRRFLRDNQSCIDIGAWIGPTVLYESQLAKHTYAIEPDPVAIRYLRKNLNLNPRLNDRVTVVDACIGEFDGTARLGVSQFPGDSESSLLLDSKRTSWSVKSFKFDTFVRDYGIDDCNFVKMDIEGGEFSVLPTMASFLSRERPTLCLSIHPSMSDDLKRDLKEVAEILQGYEFVFHGDGSSVNLDDLKNGISPRDLLMVASDEKNGFKGLLIDAVEVAAKRSEESSSDHKE